MKNLMNSQATSILDTFLRFSEKMTRAKLSNLTDRKLDEMARYFAGWSKVRKGRNLTINFAYGQRRHQVTPTELKGLVSLILDEETSRIC